MYCIKSYTIYKLLITLHIKFGQVCRMHLQNVSKKFEDSR